MAGVVGARMMGFLKDNIGLPVTSQEAADVTGLNRNQCMQWLSGMASLSDSGVTTASGSGMYTYRPPRPPAAGPAFSADADLFEQVGVEDGIRVVRAASDGRLYPLGPDMSAATIAALEGVLRPSRNITRQPPSPPQPVPVHAGHGTRSRDVTGRTIMNVRGIASAEKIPDDAELWGGGGESVYLRWGTRPPPQGG